MPDLFSLAESARNEAVIVGPYRYRLSRTWNSTLPPFVVIGVNPSTADATQDDPTIRRCVGFAKAHGCGSLVMVNLFAFRATDVRALGNNIPDAVGPENDAYVLGACIRDRALVVCAWGASGKLPPRLRSRGATVTRWLREEGIALHILRLTKGGDPEHPLYLPGELRAVRWEVPRV